MNMEKLAFSLVGPIVSPIFRKLENMALPYFGGDITEEELQHVQNTILPKIKAVLMAAEAKNLDALKPWLMTLKEAAYEAEDVLDMYEYQRLKAKVSSVPNCIKILEKKARDVAAPFSLKTALKKSMEKLIKIAAGTDQFTGLIASFTGQDPMNQQQQQQQQQQQHASVSSPSSLVIGRDHERDTLVNMLISAANMPSKSSERRIPVIAIYGIGGAGKTTLAQWIYNDSRIVEHFDTKMWVHVSRKFDAHTVTEKIIESIKRGECPHVKNIDALHSILKDMLRSKRFLLVLDDVWRLEKELWDQMLIPLNEVGDMGSRILITSRAEEVTSMLGVNHSFPLAELDTEDYRSIFMHYSFGEAKKDINDPELLVVASKIVKKLNKSPLAARVVGSLLRGKPTDDWKLTLKKGDMLKDTLGALYLSFEHLPSYLQRCFAFCSLYPKGYIFSKLDNFVRLWIAQGFVEVPRKNTITVEDEAMRYFNELLSNSFFQKDIDSHGKAYYGMHDLLHDLAEEVSKDYCFRIEDDCEHIPTNVMHLSVLSKDISSHIPDIFKLVNLRSFIIVSLSDISYFNVDLNDFFGVIKKVFMKFKKLRALHLGLGYNGVLKLDKSVGRLKHLRSFQMGEVNKLPKSMGELYHLQFLVFQRSIIDKVPQNLNNLINLRYIRGGNVMISKIPLFGKLTSLQSIERYQASKEKQLGIGQLKNLEQLRGLLCIYNLENVKDKAEASEASLKEKKHVDKLELQWERSSERDSRMDEEVLQGLQPPPNLSVLKLDGYNGVRIPKWTQNDESLSGMHFLDLECLYELLIVNCHNLLQVPSLPTMLGRLVIWGCANLSEVPLLPVGLRVLSVHGCPKLVQSQSRFLHKLEELDLEECGGVENMLSNMSLCKGENESIQGGFVLKRLRVVKCSMHRENELCPDKLISLTHLTFTELPWLTSLLLSPNPTALEYVKIESCENLRSIGNSLVSILSLKFLHITNCPRLTVQQEHQQPDNRGGVIEFLLVAGCPQLTSLWNLNCFTSLRVLSVMGCPKLTIKSGDSLSPSSSLQTMTIDDLSLLTALPGRECLNSLSSLTIQKSTQDKPFTAEQEELFQHLTSLTSLKFNSCEGLPSLPANLEKLTSLRSLYIWSCPKIESLPNLPASLEPEQVDIHRCHPQLQRM